MVVEGDFQGLLNDEKKLDEIGGVEEVAKYFKSDLKNGLTSAQIKKNLEIYGRNIIPEVQSKSFFSLLLQGFEDQTLIMLSIAAIISLVLGINEDPKTGWIEGFAIILAVLIVVFVTAGNDYEKEKQFRKLNAKKDMKNVTVIRDGVKNECMVHDIVPGDLVVIDTGDIFAADGIFVSGHNVMTDESSATGETNSKKKGNSKGHGRFLMSGTRCLDGVGTLLVFATGEKSFQGINMMSLREESGDTPLQDKLNGLADDIGNLGLFAAVVMFGVLALRDSYTIYMDPELGFDSKFASNCVRYIITSVTILVVAIPEGLPLAVTISLAFSMVKMLEDNNLVRKLHACETMGGATTICSDKTGTLTQNKMTVVKGLVAHHEFDEPSAHKNDWSEDVKNILCVGIAVNTTAYRKHGETGFIGSKTESALLTFSEKLNGVRHEKTRTQSDVVHMYPFSSANKQMGTLVRTEKNSLRYYVKGAAEQVIEHCSHVLNSDGSVSEFGKPQKKEIDEEIEKLAKEALRTIALAYVDLVDPVKTEEQWEDSPPSESLIFIGVVGIEDPLRDEVSASVEACKKAGITVRMVTGDNATTAQNIAKRCGIYNGDVGDVNACMSGPDFRKLKGEKLKAAAGNLQVLARSSPTDKKLLVDTLRAMGEIVAVTGDGTNDAPALKSAHVGFSMGVAGTDVAIEASDIVLMDDNFASIVKAVMWGRNVFDSIRKFIQFQLTVNIVAVILAFVGSLVDEKGQSPLKPVQLLWVNLIMDTLAALALATERPKKELLDRPPYGSSRKSLITSIMWRAIWGQAIFQMAVLFCLLYRPKDLTFDVESGSIYHLTLFFNVFVMCQLFNEINSRKIHGEKNVFAGIFHNVGFLSVMVLTLVVQYLLVEYGGQLVGCEPLKNEDWIKCIGIGALSIPVGFVINFLPFMNQDEAGVNDSDDDDDDDDNDNDGDARNIKKKVM